MNASIPTIALSHRVQNRQYRQNLIRNTPGPVVYLDLSNTIRRTNRLANYGYDEIHPSDKGFLGLSSKFVGHINRLKNEPVARQ